MSVENLEQELNQMIYEMEERTGRTPNRIICSQETLDKLWEQSRMMYIRAEDEEEARGYAARYHGIPIIVSTIAEPGQVFILKDEHAEPMYFQPAAPAPDNTYEVPTLMEHIHNAIRENGDRWWARAVETTIGADGSFGFAGSPAFILSEHEVAPKKASRKKKAEPDPEIDEHSFLEILKGGAAHDAS